LRLIRNMNEFPVRSIIARILRIVHISRSLIVDASRVSFGFVLSVAPLCRFLYSTADISVRGDSMRLYRSCLKILGCLFRYLSNPELMFHLRCRATRLVVATMRRVNPEYSFENAYDRLYHKDLFLASAK